MVEAPTEGSVTMTWCAWVSRTVGDGVGQDGKGQWESCGVAVEYMGGVAMDHGSGPQKKVGCSWREETPEWDSHVHGGSTLKNQPQPLPSSLP